MVEDVEVHFDLTICSSSPDNTRRGQRGLQKLRISAVAKLGVLIYTSRLEWLCSIQPPKADQPTLVNSQILIIRIIPEKRNTNSLSRSLDDERSQKWTHTTPCL